MGRYRKLPIVIEAIRWHGDLEAHGDFFDDNSRNVQPLFGGALQIETLEGVTIANLGDWIIKGIQGETYSCRNDIFQKTYEQCK